MNYDTKPNTVDYFLELLSQRFWIHFINDDDDSLLLKKICHSIPSAGDEIRLGAEGSPRYYKVILVVWIYDEPSPYFQQRVNIGVKEISMDAPL